MNCLMRASPVIWGSPLMEQLPPRPFWRGAVPARCWLCVVTSGRGRVHGGLGGVWGVGCDLAPPFCSCWVLLLLGHQGDAPADPCCTWVYLSLLYKDERVLMAGSAHSLTAVCLSQGQLLGVLHPAMGSDFSTAPSAATWTLNQLACVYAERVTSPANHHVSGCHGGLAGQVPRCLLSLQVPSSPTSHT